MSEGSRLHLKSPQFLRTSVFQKLNLALATGFFLSYLPHLFRKGKHWTGGGTIGTLLGLVSLPLLPQRPETETFWLVAVIALACIVCHQAEKTLGHCDDQRIIFDEWVGYWTAVAFHSRTWPLLITGFFLFRFFDMWKSRLGHVLSRWPGGLGVVMDDILAGLYTNLALYGLKLIVPL